MSPNYSAIEATTPLAVTPPSLPRHPSPGAIRGHLEHPIPHRTSPHTSSLLSDPSTARIECRLFIVVARSPRRPSASGEALNRTPVSSSSSLCSRSKPPWPGVAVGRAPMSSSDQQWRPVHAGLKPQWSTTRGPR
jgi:hypothetical protein